MILVSLALGSSDILGAANAKSESATMRKDWDLIKDKSIAEIWKYVEKSNAALTSSIRKRDLAASQAELRRTNLALKLIDQKVEERKAQAERTMKKAR
jgi:hypothetical protein